jgi:hypothetical protein
MTVLGMHATASQLHHSGSQVPQTGQIELGIAVSAAGPPSLLWRQHAVGSDGLPCATVTHQKMLAIVIEDIDVMALKGRLEPRAHFSHKNVVSQALRLPDLVQVSRPNHFHTAATWRRARCSRRTILAMK